MYHIGDMKSYISLLSSLLLLLQTPPAATGHRDIVIATCKKCAAADGNVNYTLCIKSFGSVPKSHHSSLKGLGVVATRLALANATSIGSKVKRILGHNNKPMSRYMKSCLQACLELYSDPAQALRDSARVLRARRHDDASTLLSSVVDAPGTCEDGFDDGGIESPLTADNDEFFWRVVIALIITAMLQGHVHR